MTPMGSSGEATDPRYVFNATIPAFFSHCKTITVSKPLVVYMGFEPGPQDGRLR